MNEKDEVFFKEKQPELEAVLTTVRDILEAADLEFAVVVKTACGRLGAMDASHDTPQETRMFFDEACLLSEEAFKQGIAQ